MDHSGYDKRLIRPQRDYGNPYTAMLYPTNRTIFQHEWAPTGYRRSLVNYPEFLDAKSGDIIVSERDSHRLQIFSCVGEETRFEPFGRRGSGKNEFLFPGGVVTTPITGANVIVADTGNRRVVYLGTLSDQHGHGFFEQHLEFGNQVFSKPMGIAYDFKRPGVIVVDEVARRVTMHDIKDGRCFGEFRPHASLPFLKPIDIAMDEYGRCYVTDAHNHCVMLFDRNGDFIGRFGEYGTFEGSFRQPHGVCIDRRANVVVADHDNNRVQMFTPDGQFQRIVTSDVYGPKAVAVNVHENLVVSTSEPYNFLKIMKYK
ncbi:hypothetical protein NP493_26g01021 [Ridgeia piscesae]|uniref:Uncharacterized protein n=1 Tax=Ridgeia piscesae TaxID=27915 RepID=A0AAD9PD38_RIDPI|nr:hypothetical protein NP493_26g01021 [Ridgeia piscesae]